MKPTFKEVQRFRQWWLWLILIGVVCIPTYGLVQQLLLGKPFGSRPMSDSGLLVFFGGTWLLLGFFRYLELRTEIDPSGMRVHLRPLSRESFSWDRIERLELVRYGFVGYGLRFSIKYGTVYNTSGNKGLSITLKSGGRYLIGTRDPGFRRYSNPGYRLYICGHFSPERGRVPALYQIPDRGR